MKIIPKRKVEKFSVKVVDNIRVQDHCIVRSVVVKKDEKNRN